MSPRWLRTWCGADLEEHPVGRGQRLNAVGEADRFPDVPCPVVRPGRRHVRSAIEIADEWDPRRRIVQAPGDSAELVEDRIHQRRVERVRDVQRLSASTPSASKRSRAPIQLAARRTMTTLLRTVDGGDRNARGSRASAPEATASAPNTASHRAARGSDCISRPRLGDRAAAPSSSVSTPAMHAATYSPTLWPEDDVGLDAPRLPELGERVLEREQRRLRVAGLGRARPARRSAGEQQRRAAAGSRCGIDAGRRTGRARRGTPAASRRARGPCPRTASPGR